MPKPKTKSVENPTPQPTQSNLRPLLYYNTKPVFFSHNSIDQIHPNSLNSGRYFQWNLVPKVTLNWINQTEALFNSDVANITQIKLEHWFDFPIYFNVLSFKMISNTVDPDTQIGKRIYQYHLKLNAHNTFLPTIFNAFKTEKYAKYLIQVNRATYGDINNDVVLAKKDPMLDFRNKQYVLIRSAPNAAIMGGLRTYNQLAVPNKTQNMPEFPNLENHNFNWLYFVWSDYELEPSGSVRWRDRQYKTIKWYIWKNPRTQTYILIPSYASSDKQLRNLIIRNVRQPTDPVALAPVLNRVIDIQTGKTKAGLAGQFVYINSFNNDRDIEQCLLNSGSYSEFGNQNNFVGAFYGPAIYGGGVWDFYKPNWPSDNNNKVFLYFMLLDNLFINNISGFAESWTSIFQYSKISLTATAWNVLSEQLVLSDLVANNTLKPESGAPYNAYNCSYIFDNIYTDDISFKSLFTYYDTVGLIAPTTVQIGNHFTAQNLDFVTPSSTFTYQYPQTNTVITDAYQQYLNSVRNTQDTTLSIAKQQRDLGISKNAFGMVSSLASNAATLLNPFNFLNPAKLVSAGASAFGTLASGSVGIASEVLAYENKQKEIDAANLDKKNSIGAGIYSSDTENQLKNLIFGRGLQNEYSLLNQDAQYQQCELHPMYWTSMIGKLPNDKNEVAEYINYLFWNGIYIDHRLPIENFSALFSGGCFYLNNNASAGFCFIDMEIDDFILNDIFGNLNNDYKQIIKTIFSNGLRLYHDGFSPLNLKSNTYQPNVT